MDDLITIAIIFVILEFVMAILFLAYKNLSYLIRKDRNLNYQDFFKARTFKRTKQLFFILLPLIVIAAILFYNLLSAYTLTDDLHARCSQATHMKIRTGGLCHRKIEQEQLLYETKDDDKIKEIVSYFEFSAPSLLPVNCRCCGDMTFEFHDKNGKVEEFSFHHGQHIRRKNDIPLTGVSRKTVNKWLAQNGITDESLSKIREDYRKKERALYEELLMSEEIKNTVTE